MNTRVSTSAIWIAAAIVAVGAGTLAVVAAAADSGDRLTQDEIARQLEQARQGQSESPATQTPRGSAPPSDSGASTPLSTTGAVIQATCDGALAYLDSWSPKPGYRVDEVGRGPADEAFVFLESDTADDVTVFVRCEGGTPVATPVVEGDDHGGDDGGDDHSGSG